MSGFKTAFGIIFQFDKELMEIVMRSLVVSISASLLASAVAIPIFLFLGSYKFKGEGFLSRLLSSLMSTPSVFIGLVVMLFLGRRGPLGDFQLLYTVPGMIIAQFFLVLPLISAMTYELSKNYARKIKRLGLTLGANKFQNTILSGIELKDVLFIYIITTFSRAISEVGVVMMVGGNMKGFTSVMTTTISMYNSMGEYEMAIALGIILVTISFVINWCAYSFKEKGVKYGS